MRKLFIVQALEDVKYEQSSKGKGFKEAECLIVLCDPTSKDEFVATLHGNDAIKEFPIGEHVMVTLKARAKCNIVGKYTQLLDVTHIEVVKREIKHRTFEKEVMPWE